VTDEELILARDEPLPGMPELPEDQEARVYERTRDAVIQARDVTMDRLRALRKQREELNAEIKLLVDEADLLDRMSRVKKKPPAK
jgi:uncharacterized coiled-coil DUF342 family protein